MNRQARKTRQNIVEAFLYLLQKKPLNSITVKEITDATGISRVAFYYHYNDVYDLFEKVQKEAIETITGFLDETLMQNDSSLFEQKLFSYIEANQAFLAILIKEGLAPAFILKALDTAKIAHNESTEHLSAHLEKTDSQIFVDYQFVYMAGGTLFMIFDWITRNQDLSSKKMALLAEIFNRQMGTLSS